MLPVIHRRMHAIPDAFVAPNKVRAQEFEDKFDGAAEKHELRAMLVRLFEHRSLGDRHQQRHDSDTDCLICVGVEGYLEGRSLTEDQQRDV